MTERLQEIKELLDHVGNEANLLHQAKLKREVLNMFKEQAKRVEGLLEQTGHNFEVNRKLDAENQRYKQALELVEDELEYAKTTGNDEVRDKYIKNSIRFINEALERER